VVLGCSLVLALAATAAASLCWQRPAASGRHEPQSHYAPTPIGARSIAAMIVCFLEHVPMESRLQRSIATPWRLSTCRWRSMEVRTEWLHGPWLAPRLLQSAAVGVSLVGSPRGGTPDGTPDRLGSPRTGSRPVQRLVGAATVAGLGPGQREELAGAP
jgi:hypothetical protein